MHGIHKSFVTQEPLSTGHTSRNLTYGCATIAWCEVKRGWVTPTGELIRNRRSAGDYVDRMHKVITRSKNK